MQIITAPQSFTKKDDDVLLFLAGGIQNCKEWQKEFIGYCNEFNPNYGQHLVIFNPRRDNFPIHDKNAAREQIQWEFEWLEKVDIFSMYFDGPTVSDQPICFYELGRHLNRMITKWPNEYQNRVVLTVSPEFKRFQDVIIQTELACSSGEHQIRPIIGNNVKKHFAQCLRAYNCVAAFKGFELTIPSYEIIKYEEQ